MAWLDIRLFGKLEVLRVGQLLPGLDVRKTQELFCYLLLNRQRLHPREALADLICADCPSAQSRKGLRQALWQLQAAFNGQDTLAAGSPLLVEAEWVGLNPAADLWIDVAQFEQAFEAARGTPGDNLTATCAHALQGAVDLYRSDLLEGWYADWCLFERERLQRMYLGMLDKLMAYGEARHEYELALDYGSRSLAYDRAVERTHQRLMRLHYLAGDRAAALRQYERCVEALHAELGVRPARRTVLLNEQIRADRLDEQDVGAGLAPVPAAPASTSAPTSPGDVLLRLKRIQAGLNELQRELLQEVQAIEQALNGRANQ